MCGPAALAGVLAGVFAIAGCVADPEHTNRFDPESPIELQAGGTLTGTVLLEKSASAADVTVALSDGSSSVVTEADGRFTLGDIRPGTYSLVLSRGGYRQVTTSEYEVGVGEVKDLGNIEMIRGRGRITGAVTFPAGAATVPVTVTLRGESVAEDTGTGSDGAFSFNEIPIGKYTLTARGEGFVATCGDAVEIASDGQAVAAAELKLLSATARIWLKTAAGARVEYTNQTALELDLSEVDTSAFSEFRFGQSDDLSTAVYAPLVASQAVTISGADGRKRMYVQFKDRCGSETGIFETPEIELDTGLPSGWVVINDNAPYLTTQGGTGVLDLSAYDTRSPITEMQITVGGVAGAWQAYAVRTDVTFDTTTQGAKTVSVIFRDQAGNESAPVTDDIVFDSVAPAGAAIALQGLLADDATTSATLTAYPYVDVTLTATDELALEVALSEASITCATASYEPFYSPMPFALSATDGAKTVYACFRDAAGNVTASPVNAGITLDMTAPSGTSIKIAGLSGNGWTREYQNLALSLDAKEAKWMAVDFTHETDTAIHREFGWEEFAKNRTIPLTVTDGGLPVDGRYYVWVEFMDEALNVSPWIYAVVNLDTTVPGAAQMQIGDSSAYTSGKKATVYVWPAYEAATQSAVAQMRTYVVGKETGDWKTFSPVTAVDLWGDLAGCTDEDCTQTAQVDLRDEAGNEKLDAAHASVTLDVKLPSAPNLEPPKHLITADTSVAVSATFPPRGGVVCDKNFLRFELSGGDVPGPDYEDCTLVAGSSCNPASPSFVYQLSSDQQNVLRVRAIDVAGNVSQDSFVVVTQDSTPPEAPEIGLAQAEDGGVFLFWTSPDTDADISAYLVYYGSMSGQYNGSDIAEGTSPIVVTAGAYPCSNGMGRCAGGNIRLTGLKNATDVYLAVSALDQVQPDPHEGPVSKEVRVQPNKLNPVLFGRMQSVYSRMVAFDRYLLAVTGGGVEAFDLDDGVGLMSYKGGIYYDASEDASDLVADSVKNRLYVATGESGIGVVDLTGLLQTGDIGQGDRKTTFRVPGTAVRRVAYMSADSGQTDLVFAAGDNGLYIVDATDIDNMKVLPGGLMAGTEITALAAVDDANGRHLFVGSSQYGLVPFAVGAGGQLAPSLPVPLQPEQWDYCFFGCPVTDIVVAGDRVLAVERNMGVINTDRAKLIDYAGTYDPSGVVLSSAKLSEGPHAMDNPVAMAALPNDTDGRRRFVVLGHVPGQEYGKIEVWKYLDPTAAPADKDKLVCDKGCAPALPDFVPLQGEGAGLLFDATSAGRHADDWIIVSRQALGFEIFKNDPAVVPAWTTPEHMFDTSDRFYLPGDSRRLARTGDLVLVADGANGFITIDVTSPLLLNFTGRWSVEEIDGATPVPGGRPKVLAVAAAGPAALVGGTFGLVVVDLANARAWTPVTPADIRATVLEDKLVKQIEVSGDRAYVWEHDAAAVEDRLHVFDLADVLKGNYAQFDSGSDLKLTYILSSDGPFGGTVYPAAFAVSGDFVFVVRNPPVSGTFPDIMALDLSDTANPKGAKAGTLQGGTLTSIRVENHIAHVTDRKFGLLTYDLNALAAAVTDPPAAVLMDPSHSMPIVGRADAVTGHPGLAYAGTNRGISVADVSVLNRSEHLSDVAMQYEARHLMMDGPVIWAAAGDGGIISYLISRPQGAAPLGIKGLGLGGEAAGVAVLGDWVFALNTFDFYKPGSFEVWEVEQYYARDLRSMMQKALKDPDFPAEKFTGVGQMAAADGSLYLAQYRYPHASSCGLDADCPQGFKCDAGACAFSNTCAAPGDCPADFTCQLAPDGASSGCVYTPAAGRCVHSADCANGLICKDPDGVPGVGEPYTDTNANGRCDTGVDTFTDLNGNGVCDGDEPWTDTNINGAYDAGEPFADLQTCGDGKAFRVVRMGVGHDGQPHAFKSTDWIAPPHGLMPTSAPIMYVSETRVTAVLSGVSYGEGRYISQVLEFDLIDPGFARKDRLKARYDLTPDANHQMYPFTAIERYGKRVYLLSNTDLYVFDTDPFDIDQVKIVPRFGDQFLRVWRTLFATSQDSGKVRAYSLDDPLNPVLAEEAATSSPGRLFLSGFFLFTGSVRTLADGTRENGGFQVFDVGSLIMGDPASGSFNPVVYIDSGSNEVAAVGPYLFLANHHGIQMFEMR
jgi:hypothetical protein